MMMWQHVLDGSRKKKFKQLIQILLMCMSVVNNLNDIMKKNQIIKLKLRDYIEYKKKISY